MTNLEERIAEVEEEIKKRQVEMIGLLKRVDTIKACHLLEDLLVDEDDNRSVWMEEECDCGSHIRHNNGGNYHQRGEISYSAGNFHLRLRSTSDFDEATSSDISCGEAIEILQGWLEETAYRVNIN